MTNILPYDLNNLILDYEQHIRYGLLMNELEELIDEWTIYFKERIHNFIICKRVSYNNFKNCKICEHINYPEERDNFRRYLIWGHDNSTNLLNIFRQECIICGDTIDTNYGKSRRVLYNRLIVCNHCYYGTSIYNHKYNTEDEADHYLFHPENYLT